MKVFVVDLAHCNGCHNCQLACKDEHCGNDWSPYALPQPITGQFWCRVDQREFGRVPWVRVEYTPKMCAHCSDAPCIEASGGAVYRRDDGLVIIDPEKAAGMQELVDACPFGSIYWNAELGVPQKCTGCAHLLDDGWEVPRCVDACATGALRYLEEDEAAELLEGAQAPSELAGFGPNLRYINVPKRRIVGSLVDAAENEAIIGAEVRLLDAAGEACLETCETDDFGDFEFWLDSRDSYVVEASVDGFESKRFEVNLADDDAVIGDVFLT